MCELAEGESAEVHIESHDLIRCSLDSRIDEILQLSFAPSEPSPSSIPLAVRRYSAGRDIGRSGHEPRSRLGIVQFPVATTTAGLFLALDELGCFNDRFSSV